MQAPTTGKGAQLWARLARVSDPELDEPVTDLGFIERIAVLRDRVEVDFRLPTYWCSPNFAFLMAEGIRREILALPWVAQVRVRLVDHLFADKVNRGVNEGLPFACVFAEEEGGDLDELRAKFEEKAFQRRQEAVLLALRERQVPDEAICAMTLADLDRLRFTSGPAAAELPRYRAILRDSLRAAAPGDPAFVTWAGDPLSPATLPAHMARLRSVRINMEFNGALCRGLQAARYRDSPEEPELIDFILNRVPPREPLAGRA
ncbi:iron-sulfur cluster assembly protein [Rhodobacter sp. CZR27]|uniref:iron-sulfur cluster assembly protein n=1 Tax=Rhodobacter sp. CZR27 TaxID=2033869 RepID=UPI000BBE6934|nr:iron-sulfur cluster assembly protein [Rhodobacter sp. CZR27]